MASLLHDWRRWLPLLGGPLLFALIQATMPDTLIDPMPRIVLGLTAWMAVWWVTEPVPIPVTSFLPMVLLPLTGVMPMDEAVVGYANPVIYMYMGGFILAIAIERWNLHRRIALSIVNRIGNSLRSIVLGVMIASAFLSMWISNAATALMMLPIAVALLGELDERDQFAKHERDAFARTLLLTVAYSASIGGLATIIGSVPNGIVVAMIPQFFDVEISFLQWMIFALPLTLILLAVLYVYLTRIYAKVPSTRMEVNFVAQELEALGPMSREEKRVLGVFVITALAWALRGWLAPFFDLPINDTLIAIIAAISLFIIPAHSEKRSLLVWEDMKELPWGLFILWGGGMALAAAFSASDLTGWISDQLELLDGVSYFWLLLFMVFLMLFLTEIISNTATANMALPITAGLATAITTGNPLGLMVAVALATTCAFMLPISTPPNAAVFSSGRISILQMAKAGLFMNIVSAIVISVFVYFVMPLLLPTP
ncbi:SLC13 family permease [Halomonas dongshanensis]|uniref:SLC13 family permease n=1 Tax=Halomonas dongshanensis TaxID=2890835 RepID=A0ABT2EBG9_9GAMM|nr:SLC13 family permease [Halomonas dongshanensis]MCS2608895.1 SLC13 family permease [Halomonas dongshanensis]